MARPLKAISLADIQKAVPNFDLSWLKDNKNDARALLWRLGLDVEHYDIEVQENIKHRSVLCGIVNCPRIVSSERVDKAWLTSGYASEEAKLYTKDSSMLKELRKISRRV